MSRVTSHAKIKKVVVDILQFKKKIFPGLLNFFFSKQVKKKNNIPFIWGIAGWLDQLKSFVMWCGLTNKI